LCLTYKISVSGHKTTLFCPPAVAVIGVPRGCIIVPVLSIGVEPDENDDENRDDILRFMAI
jgi:hypothetical protein